MFKFFKIGILLLVFTQNSCASKTHTCNLVKIKDGDSIVCKDKNIKLEIRLANIDAPEFNTKNGLKATKALKKILPLNTKLRLEIYGTDKYKRSIATVYKGNLDVNKYMLKIGMAKVFHRYLHNDKKAEYIKTEKYARAKKLGIWR